MSITVHTSTDHFFVATRENIQMGKAYMTKFGTIAIGRNVAKILMVTLDGGLIYADETDVEVQEVDLDVYVKYK